MRVNKKVENGLLLCFYLARAGRGTLEAVSSNLGLSLTFLGQVARKLRMAGILKSTRGLGGGYELNPTTTVLDVYRALEGSLMLTESIKAGALTQSIEKRALYNTVQVSRNALMNSLNVTITEAGANAVKSEIKRLDEVNETNAINN